MAMLPFCGYNMADYFQHWLSLGEKGDKSKLPKIFFVNWFRRDEGGRFLWPGYGENSRVLKWVFERIDGKAGAAKTAIGNLPPTDALDLSGLTIDERDLHELLSLDTNGWREAVPQIRDHFDGFGDRLPGQLTARLNELEQSLA